MLSRVAQSLVRNVRHTSKLASFQPAQIKFSFSSQLEEKASNLKKLLQDEIQYEEGNKPDLSEQLNYFKSESWAVNHNKTQVELSKQNGPYQLRLLFNVRTPISEEEEAEQGN